MEILKGMIHDPGYQDTECTYGKVDDNTLYYFIADGKLENGNIIVSTNLKEAIGHARHTSLGLIDPNGNLLIPCENKSLKQVGNKEDKLLLAEKAVPTTESVVTFLKNKDNPANQQSIEENDKKKKDQIIQAMGMSGDFIFASPGSEAALYTVDGINVGNGYYSYIAELNSNYYFTSNVPDSQILTFNPAMLSQQTEQPIEQANTQEQLVKDNSATINNTDQPMEQTKQPVEQGTMPNIDIPIEQQIKETDMQTPPQVEPETPENVVQSETITEETKEEQPKTEGTISNITPNETINTVENSDEEINNNAEISSVSNENEVNENTEIADEENEIDEDTEINDEENKNEVDEDTEITDEENENEVDEDTEINDEENEDEVDEDTEITDEENEDEVDEDTEINDEENEDEMDEDTIEKTTPNEHSNAIQFPNPKGSITDEDIATPGIQNATQTIRNLLEVNRQQRLEIDKQSGEIDVLKSNLEIIREDNEAKELEISSLRQEVTSYRTQALDNNRENIKLKAAMERQNKIVEALEEQNNELRGQVAGLHTLNNAVVEANALVQPIEPRAKSYTNGSLDVYGDFNYLGNSKSKGRSA